MNPAYGGFYGQVFNRVKSITATGANQVTITLKQPDYWLEGELSSMPGIIIQKSYAQKAGQELRHARRRHHVHRRVQVQVLDRGRGRHRRSSTRTTGTPRSSRWSSRS